MVTVGSYSREQPSLGTTRNCPRSGCCSSFVRSFTWMLRGHDLHRTSEEAKQASSSVGPGRVSHALPTCSPRFSRLSPSTVCLAYGLRMGHGRSRSHHHSADQASWFPPGLRVAGQAPPKGPGVSLLLPAYAGATRLPGVHRIEQRPAWSSPEVSQLYANISWVARDIVGFRPLASSYSSQ